MRAYFAAALWGVSILLSMIGHGSIVKRLLCPDQDIDWGWRAAWGLTLSACVGGVLDLTGTISRTTVLLFLLVGFLSFVLGLARTSSPTWAVISSIWVRLRDDRSYRFAAILVVFVGLFLAARYAISVSLFEFHGSTRPDNFNVLDDFQAYYVFPRKMLETGSMGPDPFSFRRISGSLGGQTFLQTFVLCVLSEQNINILDIGLGPIIVSGLLVGYLQKTRAGAVNSALMILLFLLVPLPSVNSTSLATAVALFLSLFRTLASDQFPEKHVTPRALLIGMHVAALCSLKSSHFLPCAAMVSFAYAIEVVRQRFKRGILSEAFLASVFSVSLLLPWMVDMYRTNRTMLYPVLGKGYIAYGYPGLLDAYTKLTSWRFFPQNFSALPIAPFFALGGLALLSFTRRGIANRDRNATLGLLVGVCVGTIGTVKALGGFSGLYRYVFPFVMAAILVVGMHALERVNASEDLRRKLVPAILVTGIVALLLMGSSLLKRGRRTIAQTCAAPHRIHLLPLVPEGVIERHRQMQAAIPPGATVVTRLERPFLLNFRRNQIFIVDYPGWASPPPGMPFFAGSEALAEFFSSQSIRYVAYDYATEAAMSRKGPFARFLATDQYFFAQMTVRLAFDFQDNLEKLGDTRKRIYDDGSAFVVDLLQRSPK